MTKTIAMKSMLAAAAFALGAACAAQAQEQPRTPQIKYNPVGEAPTAPDGLQMVCVSVPNDGAPSSKTCPVIYYQNYQTWIYSFADNRTAFALISFDSTGKVVQNISRNGARYVFDAMSDDKAQTITIVGQAKNYVTINWTDLPH
ncbi:MAG: hypothetical protein J7521_12620 [Caulobacter sp.]|nr:hypothetical protein [Caulobacter sp.]